jgi:hypothetical protein
LGAEFLPIEKLKIFGDPGEERIATYSLLKAGYELYVKENTFGHLLARWFAAYPEILEYFEWVRKEAPKDKHGERLIQMVRSKRYRAGCTYCQACNTGFQSPAADGAKRALFYLSYEMYCVPSSPLYGARIVAFVHDEVIIEIDWDKRTKGLARACDIMAEAMNHTIPDVPCTVEPAAMLRWTKSAETIYRDGELLPWELHRIEELPALIAASDEKKQNELKQEYEELFEFLERKGYVHR